VEVAAVLEVTRLLPTPLAQPLVSEADKAHCVGLGDAGWHRSGREDIERACNDFNATC
jgi:hypothetical protein